MKPRTGHLYRQGKNWYCSWKIDGKTFARVLRDENNNSISDKRKAEVAKAKLMEQYKVSDNVKLLQSVMGHLQGEEAQLAKLQAQQNPPLEFVKAWSTFLNSDKRKETVRAGQEVLENYERQLEHFGKWIATTNAQVKALNQVTLQMAKAYRVHLAGSGRSPNTVNKYLSALLLIWNILKVEAHIVDNPWGSEAVGREEEDTAGRETFTAAEVKKICESASGDMQNLFALAAMTGLRLKDCCLLKWTEVDLNAGEIRRVPSKTKRFNKNGNGRVVIPIPSPLLRILSGLEQAGEYVMPKIAERYLTHKRELVGEIQQHIESCGIKTRGDATVEGRRSPTVKGFHSFRHFFISGLLQQKDMPLLAVRKMAGHSSQWMTDRYSHVLSLDASRSGVALLANSIDTTATTMPDTRTPEQKIAEARTLVEALTAKNAKTMKEKLLKLLS
jgi:integrase